MQVTVYLGSGFRIQNLEHIPAYPPMPYAGTRPDLLHDAFHPEAARRMSYLLGSVMLVAGARLWTRDKRLLAACRDGGAAYVEEP